VLLLEDIGLPVVKVEKSPHLVDRCNGHHQDGGNVIMMNKIGDGKVGFFINSGYQ